MYGVAPAYACCQDSHILLGCSARRLCVHEILGFKVLHCHSILGLLLIAEKVLRA